VIWIARAWAIAAACAMVLLVLIARSPGEVDISGTSPARTSLGGRA